MRPKKKQLSYPRLFTHNHSQEPHAIPGIRTARDVDVDINWFKKYDINPSPIEGVSEVRNPILKIYFIIFLKK